MNDDINRLHEALGMALRLYELGARRSGRTSRMLEQVRDGEIVVCLNASGARRVQKELADRGMRSVRVMTCTPVIDEFIRTTVGNRSRIHLDHEWVHEWYSAAIIQATRELDGANVCPVTTLTPASAKSSKLQSSVTTDPPMMIEPSNAERSEWPDATRAYVEALEAREFRSERLAERLMQMAARRSVETSFGWTHPDCEVLQGAASTLRGAPLHDVDQMPVGVLSLQNQ